MAFSWMTVFLIQEVYGKSNQYVACLVQTPLICSLAASPLEAGEGSVVLWKFATFDWNYGEWRAYTATADTHGS